MSSRLSSAEQLHRSQMFAQGLLWCSHCKEFKPVEKFYQVRSETQRSNFGHRRYCIRCEYDQKSNHEYKKQHRRNRSLELKRRFVALAGGSCQRCGYSEFLSGLDFHHIDPSLKKCDPARVLYSNREKETLEELDKCCLLCSCCHDSYEAGEWRVEFVKREGLGWTVGDPLPLDDNRYGKRRVGRRKLY